MLQAVQAIYLLADLYTVPEAEPVKGLTDRRIDATYSS